MYYITLCITACFIFLTKFSVIGLFKLSHSAKFGVVCLWFNWIFLQTNDVEFSFSFAYWPYVFLPLWSLYSGLFFSFSELFVCSLLNCRIQVLFLYQIYVLQMISPRLLLGHKAIFLGFLYELYKLILKIRSVIHIKLTYGMI